MIDWSLKLGVKSTAPLLSLEVGKWHLDLRCWCRLNRGDFEGLLIKRLDVVKKTLIKERLIDLLWEVSCCIKVCCVIGYRQEALNLRIEEKRCLLTRKLLWELLGIESSTHMCMWSSFKLQETRLSLSLFVEDEICHVPYDIIIILSNVVHCLASLNFLVVFHHLIAYMLNLLLLDSLIYNLRRLSFNLAEVVKRIEVWDFFKLHRLIIVKSRFSRIVLHS